MLPMTRLADLSVERGAKDGVEGCVERSRDWNVHSAFGDCCGTLWSIWFVVDLQCVKLCNLDDLWVDNRVCGDFM